MKQVCKLSNRASFVRDQYLHFLRAEDGLSIVEYAIAASLVGAAIAVSFGILGTTIDALIVTLVAAL
ncbi:MAG: pilus assembly protein Flp/PilA [Woeseiaceae bacterium]|jgi:pilus assembly protein Flp/PilA